MVNSSRYAFARALIVILLVCLVALVASTFFWHPARFQMVREGGLRLLAVAVILFGLFVGVALYGGARPVPSENPIVLRMALAILVYVWDFGVLVGGAVVLYVLVAFFYSGGGGESVLEEVASEAAQVAVPEDALEHFLNGALAIWAIISLPFAIRRPLQILVRGETDDR